MVKGWLLIHKENWNMNCIFCAGFPASFDAYMIWETDSFPEDRKFFMGYGSIVLYSGVLNNLSYIVSLFHDNNILCRPVVWEISFFSNQADSFYGKNCEFLL